MAHCSVTNSAECAPLMPIIPRPPPSETARASAPPDTPAIGAPMIGVDEVEPAGQRCLDHARHRAAVTRAPPVTPPSAATRAVASARAVPPIAVGRPRRRRATASVSTGSSRGPQVLAAVRSMPGSRRTVSRRACRESADRAPARRPARTRVALVGGAHETARCTRRRAGRPVQDVARPPTAAGRPSCAGAGRRPPARSRRRRAGPGRPRRAASAASCRPRLEPPAPRGSRIAPPRSAGWRRLRPAPGRGRSTGRASRAACPRPASRGPACTG